MVKNYVLTILVSGDNLLVVDDYILVQVLSQIEDIIGGCQVQESKVHAEVYSIEEI